MVMGMLSAALGGWTDESGDVPQLRARLDEIPAAAQQVLARQSEIQRAARRFQSPRPLHLRRVGAEYGIRL